jgi:hypothetical protein
MIINRMNATSMIIMARITTPIPFNVSFMVSSNIERIVMGLITPPSKKIAAMINIKEFNLKC